MSSNTRRSTIRKIAIGFGVVIITGCVFLVFWISLLFKNGFPLAAYDYQPVPTDTYQIAAIEGNAEIKIPPSAREIYSYTTGFREISIMARLTINAAELSAFMESTLCKEPLQQISPSTQSSNSNLTWWQPDRASHLEGCNSVRELSPTAHVVQKVLVDMTNQNNYIIYVSTSMN
jgi:hypothetical protein